MIPVGIDIGTQSVFVGCYAQNQCRPMTKTAEIVLDRFSRRRIPLDYALETASTFEMGIVKWESFRTKA